MKAKLKPRIELEGRTPLETVIPLSVPFLVFLDPSSACNFKCKFCPTGDRELIKSVGRKQIGMNYEVFCKIIDDMQSFEHPIKVLRLYKEGEPLLNRRFTDMVRYAKSKSVAHKIDTTTNASLLSPEKNLDLIDSGIDRINVSINGMSSETYVDFTGYKMNMEELEANIRHLYENRKNTMIVVKIVGDILTEEERGRFLKTFGDYADRVFVENVSYCWPEYEIKDYMNVEITKGIYGQEIREVQVCPYLFYSMAINSDGTVSACFIDWARKLVIGDAKTQNIVDIWNGNEMYELRRQHLELKRKQISPCNNCGQIAHGMPDDIDKFAPEFLERINKAHKTRVGTGDIGSAPKASVLKVLT